MSECQGTPWSEELDDKELHRALGGEYDLEPRESTVSCKSLTRSHLNFQASTNVVLCCLGGVSCVFFLLPDCLFPREL